MSIEPQLFPPDPWTAAESALETAEAPTFDETHLGPSVRRVLGRLEGPPDGPLLICVAGLHGNEPAGVVALERVFRTLGAEGPPALAGRFVGLAGNLPALERRYRYLDRDLNRLWTDAYLEQVRRRREVVEDGELVELADHLGALLREIPQERRRHIFLLDLHTASGPGPSFTVLDDTLPNRAFALELEAPVVLGIEEELAGTLMHYVSDLGFTAVGFEGGRHDDPRAVDHAEAATWIALEVSGVLAPGHPRVTASRQMLARETRRLGLPRVVEVRYRHAITAEDGFRIAEGLAGFETVRQGQTLGRDRRGPIAAREAGLVLMPLYQQQGDEGFFLVRPVRPAWLSVSKAVRKLRLERFLHWLPGVRRHPQLVDSFIVDRKVARWVAPQLFHLLGFRREGPAQGRYLVMSRRFGDR